MTWDKTKPAGNLAPSVGDDTIRANNEHLELALGAEHDFPGSATAGPRRHKFPRGDLSARNALTGMVAGSVFFRTDAGEIDVYDGAAWTAYALTPAGVVMDWAGPAASIPAGWLLCDGAAVSRATYASLFAALGTTYGAGDGSTTFNLPSLGGRVRVGYVAGGDADGDYGTIGAAAGEKKHTLAAAELPAHDHSPAADGQTGNDAPDHTHQVDTYVGGGGVLGAGSNTLSTKQSAGASTRHKHALATVGAGTAHENRQPYLVLATIIKT